MSRPAILRDPAPEDGLEELRKQVDELRATNRTMLISGLVAVAIAVVARAADGIVVGWQVAASVLVLFGAVAAAIGAVRWPQRNLDPADEAKRYLRAMIVQRKRLCWVAVATYVGSVAAILVGHLLVI